MKRMLRIALMGVDFRTLVGVGVVSAVFALGVPAVQAQDAEVEVVDIEEADLEEAEFGDVEIEVVTPHFYGTPADALEQAYFQDSKDFVGSVTYGQQIKHIFGFGVSAGLGAYPENALLQDAKNVELVYRDALEQQNTSDPTIRVPDLANPFNTSLMLLPSAQTGSRVVGTEFIFERLP